MEEIKIKKLYDVAKIPERGSKSAAGYDLYALTNDPLVIEPHTTVRVHTGIAMEIPEGYFGGIFARSGLATKENLRPSNCVGCIDSDYRGEIIVALHNDSDATRFVNPGQKIAQLVVIPYLEINFVEVDELDTTERGSGGFGSTGK